MMRRGWRTYVAVILTVLTVAPHLAAVGIAATNTIPASSGSHYQTNSNATVATSVNIDQPSGNIFSSHFVDLGAGRVGGTDVDVTAGDLDAEETAFTDLDTTGTLLLDPENKQLVELSGDVDAFTYRKVSVAGADDGTRDFRYTAGSTSQITITNLPSGTPVTLYDIDGDTSLDTTAVGSDGNATFELSSGTYNIDVRQTAAPPYATNVSPDGDYYSDPSSITLNMTPVNPNGNDVDVKFYTVNDDGADTLVKSTTVANGTQVTASVTPAPGTTEWYAVLNGSVEGLSQTTREFSFRVPGQVEVFHGDASNWGLIDGQDVTAVVRSTESDYRTVTTVGDGTVELAGAPDEPLTLELSSSGYLNQTLAVLDPATNTTTVMYQPGWDAYNQSFAVEDTTGIFPRADTTLLIEGYYNGTWTRVAGDRFSADNRADVTLAGNRTYRLTVRNTNGDVRSLGDFRGTQNFENTIIELTVSSADTLDVQPDGEYGWDATYLKGTDSTDPTIEFDFATADDATADQFVLTIYERGNESNTIYERNYGSVNTVNHIEVLTENQSEKTWVVKWSAKINGEQESGEKTVGDDKKNLLSGLDLQWRQLLASIAIVLTGSAFSVRNAGVGAVVISLLGGMFFLAGWLDGALTGGTIAVAIMLSVMIQLSRT